MIEGVHLTHQEITVIIVVGIVAYAWMMRKIWGK